MSLKKTILSKQCNFFNTPYQNKVSGKQCILESEENNENFITSIENKGIKPFKSFNRISERDILNTEIIYRKKNYVPSSNYLQKERKEIYRQRLIDIGNKLKEKKSPKKIVSLRVHREKFLIDKQLKDLIKIRKLDNSLKNEKSLNKSHNLLSKKKYCKTFSNLNNNILNLKDKVNLKQNDNNNKLNSKLFIDHNKSNITNTSNKIKPFISLNKNRLNLKHKTNLYYNFDKLNTGNKCRYINLLLKDNYLSSRNNYIKLYDYNYFFSSDENFEFSNAEYYGFLAKYMSYDKSKKPLDSKNNGLKIQSLKNIKNTFNKIKNINNSNNKLKKEGKTLSLPKKKANYIILK